LKNDWNFGTTDFHSIFFYYGSQLFGSNRFSKCLQQKKETHTDLEQLEGEQMMTELSFLGGVSL